MIRTLITVTSKFASTELARGLFASKIRLAFFANYLNFLKPMTNDPTPSGAPPPVPPNESLQFDRADYAGNATALSCVLCKTPITGEYYQVNGQTVCPNCQPQVSATFTGGSKIGRAFRAMAAGIGAGVLGFLIYWGIRAVTGYELALVAILVGWMVGKTVRWGSQGRGGLFYQFMAVALTYVSIASNYCPDILKGMREAAAKEKTEASASTTTDKTSNAASAPAKSDTDGAHIKIPLLFQVIIAFFISLAAPFLMGLNPIGWIIIGVGLWEAWRLNRRIPIQITGPFNAGAQPQAT